MQKKKKYSKQPQKTLLFSLFMGELANIQAAIQCMSSAGVSQAQKKEATSYLEEFQKTSDAWNLCMTQIVSGGPDAMLQIFFAQTLRNKVTYDLNDLSSEMKNQLKTTLISLLSSAESKNLNKIILTQLSIALARLAIQYVEWQNPVQELITSLSNNPEVLLVFLRILPEETLDKKGVSLTDDEFESRTYELIFSIHDNVLQFLISCLNGGVSKNLILSALCSWSAEFPIENLITVEPLMSLVFNSVCAGPETDMDVFEKAVECLCFILRETRDVANMSLVESLYQSLIQLNVTLLIPNKDDPDILEACTRIYVEACESWCVFVAKNPQAFKPLVEIALFLTVTTDQDLDVVKYLFKFWFDLKQFLVLPRYKQQKLEYADIYTTLITGIIQHLKYPIDGFENKEEEDKFKDFRYDMGDVLKCGTAIIGGSGALSIPFSVLKSSHAQNFTWQEYEAALFSFRTMAQEVPNSEKNVLPQVFEFICNGSNLPDHPKIKYAATLVVGRYTEWTHSHPEFLEMQLNYIFNLFDCNVNHDNVDILNAAAHTLMYMCVDCKDLLSPHVDQLVDFYWKITSIINFDSNFDICQGLSSVINEIGDVSKLVAVLTTFIQQLLSVVTKDFQELTVSKSNGSLTTNIAQNIDLMYAIFYDIVPRAQGSTAQNDPVVSIIQEIWETSLKPHLAANCSNETIVEKTMKSVRQWFEKFYTFLQPLLPSVVEFLANGYSQSGLSSYLWCSSTIISIFADLDSYPEITPEVHVAVWQFAYQQCMSFIVNFHNLNIITGQPKEDGVQLVQYADMIYDFYSLANDTLMFYPEAFIKSDLITNIVKLSLKVCMIDEPDTCSLIIRNLDDIVLWGFESPPISSLNISTTPAEWRNIICKSLVELGPEIVGSLLPGLIFQFHRDSQTDVISCFANFVTLMQKSLKSTELVNQWVSMTIDQLPNAIDPKQKYKMMHSLDVGFKYDDIRRINRAVQDFSTWYKHKWISPRLYN